MAENNKLEQSPGDVADTASKSVEADIADETAGYDEVTTPIEGGAAANESEAQPS